MAFCPKCGTEVQQGGRFCPKCGTALPAAAPPSQDPFLGRLLDKKYEIQELLGVGGMGRVYRARQLSLDKVVCVKVLRQNMMQDDTLVGRFHREARAASRLNHPNSIGVTDFGQAEDDGSLYMVMEFVAGKDFGKVIREEWPLPEERLINIMDQVLSALADAHEAGIIHRDLKPENVMVTDLRGTKDFVKVLDFGIAKIQETTTEPGLTQAGMVCGTPEYMSPEQARGEELDARSDVYAAGVILYQAVVGKLPFEAPTAMGIVTKHLTEPPVPPSQIDGVNITAALEAVILKAMSKDRNGRQPTALALQQELNQVMSQKVAVAQQAPLGDSLFDADSPEPAVAPEVARAETQPPAGTGGAAPAPHGTGGGRVWLAIVVVLVMLAAAGVAIWLLFFHDKQGDGGGAGADAGAPAVVDAGGAALSSDTGPPETLDAGAVATPADPGKATLPPPDAGAEQQSPPDTEAGVPEAARLHYHAGKELMVRNKIKKAIVSFRRAVRKAPGYAAAYKALGMCHMRLGQIRAAKKNFRLYLKKAPGAADRKDILQLIESL